jgi:homoserine O-acetyltransferase
MFGNGQSTSPSNMPVPSDGAPPPAFSHVDNVTAQRRLLEDVFGIRRLALVYGWSMGGQQALHWGALYPEMVARIAALCTSAKTSLHNVVFLESLRAVLQAAPQWDGARFTAKPERALRAMARIYAGWALSPDWYRERLFESLGYKTLEEYLVGDWEASFLRRDAGNLLSMLDTWKHSDISDNSFFRGDLKAALAAIRAPTYIMPGSHDRYFTADDGEIEARQIPSARFLPIPSIWGHRAGNPAKNPADEKFIRDAIAKLLET